MLLAYSLDPDRYFVSIARINAIDESSQPSTICLSDSSNEVKEALRAALAVKYEDGDTLAWLVKRSDANMDRIARSVEGVVGRGGEAARRRDLAAESQTLAVFRWVLSRVHHNLRTDRTGLLVDTVRDAEALAVQRITAEQVRLQTESIGALRDLIERVNEAASDAEHRTAILSRLGAVLAVDAVYLGLLAASPPESDRQNIAFLGPATVLFTLGAWYAVDFALNSSDDRKRAGSRRPPIWTRNVNSAALASAMSFLLGYVLNLLVYV